ncbi:MAG: MFS transporter, partial [Microvirga sp.]
MNESASLGTAVTSTDQGIAPVYRKIIWRLIPFLFLCYVLNYIDRVNISFASLQFREDLGISTAAY